MLQFAQSLSDVHQDKPPRAYGGAYIFELEKELSKTVPEWMWDESPVSLEVLGQMAGTRMTERQASDLSDFGVVFDTMFRESGLHGASPLHHAYRTGTLYFENEIEVNGETLILKVCPLCGRNFEVYCTPCVESHASKGF